MHFYIDESGHTGPNLFDPEQPMLYYGVLSSRINVDFVVEAALRACRRQLGVRRLHGAELGAGRLVEVAPRLLKLIKQHDLRFDVYRVAKADHAIICFFDQVFDQGVNPAVTWTGYWTPMRYVLLLKVASLFDEQLAKAAWEARITVKDEVALPMMISVCKSLRQRIDKLPDARSRQIIGDALQWAENNPSAISYNVPDKKLMLQVTPNVIGFQSAMHGIASRIKSSGLQASRIVVDRQSQFNKAQKSLADGYRAAKGFKASLGPGLPVLDHTHVPAVPIEFSSGDASGGLELADVHLWMFKQAMEGRHLPSDLRVLVVALMRRGRTDEISLNAIANRWSRWFDQLPQLEEMNPEQLAKAKEVMAIDENRRLEAVRSMLDAPRAGD